MNRQACKVVLYALIGGILGAACVHWLVPCPARPDCQVLVDQAVSERNSYWVIAKKQAVDGAIVAERLACMEQVRQGYQAGRDDKVCPQCPPCPPCPETQCPSCPSCPEIQCPPCPDKVCPPDRFQEGYTAGQAAGYQAGKAEGYETGRAAGYQAGWDTGYGLGWDDGYKSGWSVGCDECGSIQRMK